LIDAADVSGIVFALVINDREDALMDRLGLDCGDKPRIDEQGVIDITFIANLGVGRPLRNRAVLSPGRGILS